MRLPAQGPRGRRRSERGFTLIELMYALGYFMIGLVGLTAFQLLAARATQQASDITLATNVAASVIEAYRVTPSQTVLAATQPQVTTYDRYGKPGGTPAYFTVTTVATQPLAATFYDVSVEVRWLMGLGETFSHSVNMYTRIAS